MKKNSVIFVDSSAWIAVLDEKNKNHNVAREFYALLLDQSATLVTNNIVMDETLTYLKENMGLEFAKKFLSIIDESVLNVTLRVDWISRRVRRMALANFLKSSNPELTLRHYYISETIKRKRVDLIFAFDPSLRIFKFPVMPQ